MQSSRSASMQALLWLALCAVGGSAMLFLFDDGCQQDGGLHYLFARWSWRHPSLLVGVWSRPLYTTLYSLPAQFGYRAARATTVLLSLLLAWQAYRLAEQIGVKRAPLAILMTWLQPSFFLFSADNMTEQIFALVCVIAVRLHLDGRLKAGMIVASLTILARPEGLFLGLLWGVILLRDRFGSLTELRRNWPRGLIVLWLGTGSLIWWLSALALTGDPLFIKHNWPSNWPLTGTVYGAAGLLAYPARLPEIVGPFLLIPFLFALWRLIREKAMSMIVAIFLLFLILHTILRAYGLLGSAGYPRYLVAISPLIAVITLDGWNRLAAFFAGMTGWLRTACATVILATSAYANFIYADGAEWSRDARALGELHSSFISREFQLPVNRLIWNEPYACILFNHDPWENPAWSRVRERDLSTLRNSPSGTLVVWDDLVGPKWFGLRAGDFEEAGYRMIEARSFTLTGYIINRSWFGFGGPRRQRYYLLYK